MSLIMDAQKAAQREKDLRASGGSRASVPLLVPLKSRASTPFNWQRAILVVGGLGAVTAIVLVVLQQNRDAIPRALLTPGPTLASIAPAPTTGAPAADTTPAKEVARVASRDSVSAPPRNTTTRPVAKQPPRRPPALNPTRARPRVVAAAPPRTPAPTGQLRVAVDQPRATEVARLFAMGVSAHRAGDAASARSAYEQVLAIAPNDVDALNNLGVLHTGLREFDRAESALRRAIALAPSSAGAWNNLGAVLRERGRSADAIAAFQRALSIDPRHAGARVGLAQQYLVISSLGQARVLLESVLRDAPSSPEAAYALGQVLERQGDKAGAVRAYQTFVQFAPPALSAYTEAVRVRIETLSRAP